MEALATRASAAQIPPHAPQAGWIRRLLGPLYVTGVFWYRIHRFGVRIVPSWAFGLLMPLFTGFFFLALHNIRAALAANLEAVLGPCGWWQRQVRTFRSLWTFSWCLTERYERLSTERRFLVSAEGLESWRDLNASGRGFLLVTAHLGAWEVGSMLPAHQELRKVHVVREAETDPRAQRFIAELIREAAGDLYETHFAEDPHLGMALLDALRQGEIVALQGDRPRAGGRTAEVSLFSRPFAMPVGPAALARAAGVPLLPVFVFREGRLRYRCSILPPIEVAHTADRCADVSQAVQRFANQLEAAIAHRPHQWFCFRKLWEQVA